MSSASATSPVKRACDACHRRKVKCIGDGSKACRNCASSGLSCTYNAVPQKKGPKGSRAKVITELRQTQRLATQQNALDNQPPSPTYPRRSGLLPVDLIDLCVTFYFDNLYTSQPILERGRVGQAIALMYEDVEAYVFVVSFCAYICIQPNLDVSPEMLSSLETHQQSTTSLGKELLEEAIRVRKSLDWVDSPSIWSVITSFYLFGSYYSLDRQNTAWFYLREAATVAQLMGMHEEASYSSGNAADKARRRCLYWLLFITERAYALQHHRPLTLHSTIDLPSTNDEPIETEDLTGFIHLVSLFRPFDDTFIGLWNKSRKGYPTGSWLRQLQKELSEALPVYLATTETQAVDLRLSQAWLKTMVWQLSMSHGALSSLAADNAMSLKYPIEISRDLLAAANQSSQQAMEVHGIGLVEKLFDVACTLTDVISCVPHDQHTFGFGPRDYLSEIVQLISTLRGGQQKFMPPLLAKISDVMPNAPYTLSIMPESSSSRISDDPTSATESIESPSFGSPPLSAVSSHGMPFSSFSRSLSIAAASTSPDLSSIVMTTAFSYEDIVVSAPMSMFHTPEMYSDLEDAKFDPER